MSASTLCDLRGCRYIHAIIDNVQLFHISDIFHMDSDDDAKHSYDCCIARTCTLPLPAHGRRVVVMLGRIVVEARAVVRTACCGRRKSRCLQQDPEEEGGPKDYPPHRQTKRRVLDSAYCKPA